MSTINKISPNLKRYVPGQILPKSCQKSLMHIESNEKQVEDEKFLRDNMFIISRAQGSRKNSSEFSNDINSTSNTIKPFLSNLDESFEKLMISFKSKQSNEKNEDRKYLQNIFKTKSTNVVSIKNLIPTIFRINIKPGNEHNFLGKKRENQCEQTRAPIFKTQKIEDNGLKFQSKNSLQNSVALNQINNLSNFDKFFLTFKKFHLKNYHVKVEISKDKKDFVFIYNRNQKVLVTYRIQYDKSSEQILLLQKIENGLLVLDLKENTVSMEDFFSELKHMLEDIVNNVEKKN